MPTQPPADTPYALTAGPRHPDAISVEVLCAAGVPLIEPTVSARGDLTLGHFEIALLPYQDACVLDPLRLA